MLRNKQPIWLHDLRTHKAEFAKSETEKQIWKKITLPRKNKAAKFLINPQTMDGLLELPDCRPSILCLLDAKMESRLVLVTHRHPTCQTQRSLAIMPPNNKLNAKACNHVLCMTWNEALMVPSVV